MLTAVRDLPIKVPTRPQRYREYALPIPTSLDVLDLPIAALRPPPSSPNPDTFFGRKIEFVARLHIERLIPGIDISDDAVDTKLPRAVVVR